jgi:hypothetical protein
MQRGILAVAFVLVIAGARSSPALLGDADGDVVLDGSIRSVIGVLDNYDSELLFGGDATDVLSQSILRLTLLGKPRAWLVYEFHGLQTLTYSTTEQGPGNGIFPAAVSSGRVRYQALDLRTEWYDDSKTSAALSLDRANVTLRYRRADVTVGRQAITFGKAYFWSILDVFLPFDPEQFDRDYKPGVDAARLDFALGQFSGVNLVAVAGPDVPAIAATASDDGFWESSWFGSAVLARAFTSAAGWDFALQGGKVFGGYHIGAGVVGELGPLELRFEAVRHFADDSPQLVPPGMPGGGLLPEGDLVENSTSVVVGTGHRFENSFTVELEYFRNGAGDSDSLESSALRSSSGGLLSWSENLIGAVLSYELSPMLLSSLGGIVSLDDGSTQLQPRINWAAGDELEILAGMIFNIGERPETLLQSEFGTLPHLFYTELKFYF